MKDPLSLYEPGQRVEVEVDGSWAPGTVLKTTCVLDAFWIVWVADTSQTNVWPVPTPDRIRKQLIIVAAAILKPDGTQVWLPPPARHPDVVREILRTEDHYDDNSEQGFRVSDGSFASREAALIIATKAGQIVHRCGGDHIRLYSENLW